MTMTEVSGLRVLTSSRRLRPLLSDTLRSSSRRSTLWVLQDGAGRVERVGGNNHETHLRSDLGASVAHGFVFIHDEQMKRRQGGVVGSGLIRSAGIGRPEGGGESGTSATATALGGSPRRHHEVLPAPVEPARVRRDGGDFTTRKGWKAAVLLCVARIRISPYSTASKESFVTCPVLNSGSIPILGIAMKTRKTGV